MSIETIVQTEDTATQTPKTESPLETIVNLIRRDSREETGRYLEETTVPHGGE